MNLPASKIRELVDKLPVLIAYLDHHERVRFSSSMHQTWWNLTEQEMIGRHIRDVLGIRNYSNCELPIKNALQNGKSCMFETYADYPGNGIRYVQVSYIPDRKPSGEIEGVFVLVTDLTDKNKIEHDLRQQQHERKVIFNSVPALIWYKDAHNKVLRVNRPAADVVGMTPEEIEGRPTSELFPDQAEHYHQDDLEVINSGVAKLGIIERMTNSHGEARWLRTDKIPYRNDSGKIQGVIVFAIDITDRVRAERELRESEARYRRLVESTGVIPWVADPILGKFTYVGPQAAGLLKVPIQDWYSEGFWLSRLHPEDASRVSKTIKGLSPENNQAEIEYRMYAGDGTVLWVRDYISLSIDEEGASSLQGFLVNISAAKETEKQRVMLEQRLLQSQKMEALGTLAGGIAHDFNNMLAGILGYSGLALAELPAGSTARAFLENIDTSACRARDLVQQILAFSQRGTLHEKQKVSACGLVRDVLALARSTFPPTIRVETTLPDSGWSILGNPSQMHQVILNVVTNACYAMREKGGVLTISVDLTPRSNSGSNLVGPASNFVRFRISDTGRGMSEDIQKRIFEPYFTTKPIGEGSGLGLSVVHGIVLSYGGNIRLESELGKGTTFEILLPLHFEKAQKVEMEARGIETGTGRILFVDDEEMMVQLANDTLTALGYEVNAFQSSAKALEAFEAHPEAYDIVITDQTMPEYTGDLVTKRVHARSPNMPVIICTGYSPCLGDVTAIDSGTVEFLMKPFSIQVLARTVARLILQNRAANSLPEASGY